MEPLPDRFQGRGCGVPDPQRGQERGQRTGRQAKGPEVTTEANERVESGWWTVHPGAGTLEECEG